VLPILDTYPPFNTHLVAFEIIGMLGKVFRIRGSHFRMVPNPTTDAWLKDGYQKASWKITRLMEVFQEKLHEFIEAEEFAVGHPIREIAKTWQNIPAYGKKDETILPLDFCESVHDALDQRTAYLKSVEQRKVLAVLVAHLTKVLRDLQDPNNALNNIVLANKEEALLTYYFHSVRPIVVGNLDAQNKPLSREEKESRNTIWISLVFRMLCWLLLHDFDKSDVKVVPANMKGSRMPIYIS
jgi:hypothetical protein